MPLQLVPPLILENEKCKWQFRILLAGLKSSVKHLWYINQIFESENEIPIGKEYLPIKFCTENLPDNVMKNWVFVGKRVVISQKNNASEPKSKVLLGFGFRFINRKRT